MKSNIIDGKSIAATLRSELSETIANQRSQGVRNPGLAVILVGQDTASEIYVRNKREACKEVGIESFYYPLSDTISEKKLIDLITELNLNDSIDGILLQLPLPGHIDSGNVIEHIDPHKDVDGFHPYNLGRLVQRRPFLRPCTPAGIMYLLEHIKQTYHQKEAVIVGASNIVGRPIALELLMAGCTITICHKFTKDLAKHVSEADILVSAVGLPNLIKGDWIKEGATVIDVGITRLNDGKIAGDIEFEKAVEKAAWITPVPGGVGPMTVAMLLKNTIMAASKSFQGEIK